MKNIISTSVLIIVLSTLFAFTTGKGKEIGIWTGSDKGKVGSVVFDEEGYAAFMVDGKTLGGKSFLQNGVELSLKYQIDYTETPIQVDFIFYSQAVEREVARMKGIIEFKSNKQMKLAVSFSGQDSVRPTDFNDENSIELVKAN